MKLHLPLYISLSYLLMTSFNYSGEQNQKAVKVVTFEQLQPLLQKENDTVYLINFWATWCAPCLKEIPSFEQLGEMYSDKKVKILMVSLDFPNQLQARLIPFIEREEMRNEVILLDDPRSNRWIPLVDEEWTGAIPATLIYGNGFSKFYQKEFTYDELEETILPLLTD
ncbi:MAG: TlpA family protein disulfide reductase [Proteiniphilum sp.]|nr:TlpA family protein disulfide reductase [Proteiniphilum sp.]